MRRLLPSGTEIAIFATMAVIGAGIISVIQPNTHDLGFAAMAGPLFLVAACMGLRRSPVWTVLRSEEADESAE